MRLLLAAALVTTACQGDPVAQSTGDASATDSGADGAASDGAASDGVTPDAGACKQPGDLVRNGSFEEGSGTSVAHWTDGRFMRREGGADECAYYAELRDLPTFDSVSEAIDVAAPAGTIFDYGFSFRTVDAVTHKVSYFLHGDSDQSTRESLPLTGEWQRFQGTLELKNATEKLVIGFNTDTAETRSVAIDRVWVVRR